MKVREIMHQGVEWVAPDTPVRQVARKMAEMDIGALPVSENGECLGMITDRDLALRAFADALDPSKLTAKDIMTKGAICCHDTEEVDEAIRLMETKKIRRLPVLNEKNVCVGMLSLGDISQAMPREVTAEVAKAVSAHHA